MNYEINFLNEKRGDIKKILWSTDLHFDAAEKKQYKLYCELVLAHEPDIIFIGGDVSNGVSTFAYLQHLSKVINKPIYFVLGNHDFYYGSIIEIRSLAKHLSGELKTLHYLTESGALELTQDTCLIGHDGWSDARAGDYQNSEIVLNDYLLINDLNRLNSEERQNKLMALGDEAANYLKSQLELAFKKYDRAIILTHVPPFIESCLYKGKPADDNWLPHFVSLATGKALEEVMKMNPEKKLLVLCGHSHSGQNIEILPNLQCVTGHSELGLPNIQGMVLVN